jgi:hypothetical protein
MRCAIDLDKGEFARQITAGVEDRGSWGDLLPFPKRKNQSDEVELGDDDFELVELVDLAPGTQPPAQSFGPGAPPPSLEFRLSSADPRSRASNVVAASPRDADQAKTVQRASRSRTILPVSRRILDEDVEEDVAGQCLASIAAETSRDAADLSSPKLPSAPPPSLSTTVSPSSPPSSITRLPSVSAPPFLRTSHASSVPFRGYIDAPGVRDSSPPAAFVRRSSPGLAVAVPAAAPSSYVAVVAAAAASSASNGAAGSVAPVSLPMSQRQEPTVIVVRERPRAVWIVAAAALGALGALGATRFLSTPAAALEAPEARAAAVAPPQAAPVLPALAVTAPASPAPPAPSAPPASPALGAPALPPAIVHFGDDDGVAIKSPAFMAPRRQPGSTPSLAAPPAGAPSVRSTGPRAPSMGPALPDGSFGLGRSDTATTSSAPTPAPALTASVAASGAPESPRKRAITPEQQLAAAQLKASMK